MEHKQEKSKYTPMEEYMSKLHSKCEEMEHSPTPTKTTKKIPDEDLIMPTIHNFNILHTTNYNGPQLKTFAKTYKLKISGTKKELVSRLFCFLKLSSIIVHVQKVFRGWLQKRCNYYRGPALLNRSLCTNDTDFLTTEPIKEMPFAQFVSYEDVDKFIYGFDIISIYNLILKTGRGVKNPYNRIPIPVTVIINMRHLIRLSKLLKVKIDIDIVDDTLNLPPQKNVELRALELFQNIDALGNYSSPQWFTSLNRVQLIRVMREIIDIWSYRAQLTQETKRQICPPHGEPYRNINFNYLQSEPNMENVKNTILAILEKIVNTGVDKDSKSLGAYYVLGALTLVNENAAASLPWLFQSLSYF